MAATTGSKKDNRSKKRPADSSKDNRKKIFIAGTVVILLAALGTLIVVLSGTERMSTCQVIRQAVAKGMDFSKKYDVSEINDCERDFDCSFDILTCKVPCPLGFETDKNRCVISCQCASSSKGTFQGDLQFDDTEVSGLLMRYGHASIQETFAIFSSSVRTSVQLWPVAPDGRAKVAYVLDKSRDKHRSLFEEAFSSLGRSTCVDFIPRTNERDFIAFVEEIGCWSRVGKGDGPQPCSMADSCLTIGLLQHEMMHAIGFEHEHVRPDRDAFITIDYNGVDKSKRLNFAKIREPVKKLGRPYDTASVTHISSRAWTSDPDVYSFLEFDGTPVIGQREKFSTEDLKEINILYNCRVQTDAGISGIPALNAKPLPVVPPGGSPSMNSVPGTPGGEVPSSSGGDTSPPVQGDATSLTPFPGQPGPGAPSPGTSGSSGPAGGSSESTIGAAGPAGSAINGSVSGASGSAIGASGTAINAGDSGASGPAIGTSGSASNVDVSGASGSAIGASGPAGSPITSGSSGSAIGAPGSAISSGSAIGGSGPAGSAIGAPGSPIGGTAVGSSGSSGGVPGQSPPGQDTSSPNNGDASAVNGPGITAGAPGSTDQLPSSASSSGIAWSQWVPWSDCTETCGRSEAIRFRFCQDANWTPAQGCDWGEWYQAKACDKDPCPGKFGMWEEWEPWEKCSRTCSLGYQWRKRKCAEDELCPGYGFGGRHCANPPCQNRKRRNAATEEEQSGP